MTTIIGIKCSNGIVIGSDSQLTISGDSSGKELNFDKIYKIGESILFSGSGDAYYIERVRQEIEKRYESGFLEEVALSVDFVPELFEKVLIELESKYNIKDYAEIIFGFYHGETKKHFLYRIDNYHCFAIEISNYYTIGSGRLFANYIFKRVFETQLTMVLAISPIIYVIGETVKIDKYSDAPIKLGLITDIGLILFAPNNLIENAHGAFIDMDTKLNKIFKTYCQNPSLVEINENGIIIKETK